MYNFVEVSGHNLENSQTWGSVYNVYIKNQFQITFAQGGGGGPFVEVTVDSKEEKSYDFCHNYFK
jgi:hypothetical protein